jgi:hypothetical protein
MCKRQPSSEGHEFFLLADVIYFPRLLVRVSQQFAYVPLLLLLATIVPVCAGHHLCLQAVVCLCSSAVSFPVSHVAYCCFQISSIEHRQVLNE